MKIAVEGCCHGELDKIYETLAFIETTNNVKVDLLLICGDFQSVRNKADLACMAVPPKYQKLNTFYKYYSGEMKAPVLTVFIGGNHEASNYLQELPYGGWVAPNIYYMGYAGVLQFGGFRIGGLSGIYKGKDFAKGHHEHPPYSEDTKRSVYHVRNLEIFRLKQLTRHVDIFLSHDWPRGIYHYGNCRALIQQKSFFKDEIESNTLGSPAAEELLHLLKPDYWFSAHLHVKFAALMQHVMDDGSSKITKFLSLDKCLPRRKFLQIIDLPHDTKKPLCLELDPEWLCVLKSTNHLLSTKRSIGYMPGPGSEERWDFTVTDADIEKIKEEFGGDVSIPDNFEKTAPSLSSTAPVIQTHALELFVNPQTTLLCTMLDLTDPNAILLGRDSSYDLGVDDLNSTNNGDDNDDDDESNKSTVEDEISTDDITDPSFIDSSYNQDEITLDEEDEPEEVSEIIEHQKEAESSPLNNLSDLSQEEEQFSLENEEDEFQAILSAQRSFSESSRIFDLDDSIDAENDSAVKLTKAKTFDVAELMNTSPIASSVAKVQRDGKRISDTPFSSDETDESSPTSSKKRKLKRRNESMYMSSTEDEG